MPIILVLAFVVYSNTFGVPFQFDDLIFFNNLRPRSISNIPHMFTEFEGPWASRPLLYATLALNYHFGGLNTSGYHAVNLALHLINCVLLYLLVTMTGRHLGYDDKNVRLTAVFSVALFALHPAQTQAVTYIMSRSMLLATAFYFSGMILFLKAVTSESRKGLWIAGLFVVSLLGMASREDFATFPVMLVLYDLFFVSRFKLKEAANNWKAYAPVLLSLGYLAYIVANNTYDKTTDTMGVSIPHVEYFLTQFNVMWTYLRLLALPINQNIDYDYPIATTLFRFTTITAVIGYMGLWAAGIALARKKPVVSFCVLWFLVVFFPISFGVTFLDLQLDDVIFEHRLYLPGVGVIVAVASGASLLWGKFQNGRARTAGAVLFVMVMVALSSAAYARNDLWRSDIGLWKDAVEKSPRKARPRYNLGTAYANIGQFEEAIEYYLDAIKFNPDYVEAYYNLGISYANTGRFDEAIKYYLNAVKLRANYVEAYNNLGTAYARMGQFDKAIKYFLDALKFNPGYAEACNNLGSAYANTGRFDEAIKYYLNAVKLKPDYVEAHNNLGFAYNATGQSEKADEQFRLARELRLRQESAGRAR